MKLNGGVGSMRRMFPTIEGWYPSYIEKSSKSKPAFGRFFSGPGWPSGFSPKKRFKLSARLRGGETLPRSGCIFNAAAAGGEIAAGPGRQFPGPSGGPPAQRRRGTTSASAQACPTVCTGEGLGVSWIFPLVHQARSCLSAPPGPRQKNDGVSFSRSSSAPEASVS